MHTLRLILLLSLLAVPLPAAEQLHLRLRQEFDAGLISRGQYLACMLIAAEDPRNLPPEYRDYGLEERPCPTLVAAEARAAFFSLSAQEQELLTPLLSRPSAERLPLSMISPEGHFRIHYSFTGYDSTSLAFAEEAARSFEYAYALLVDSMGYAPPPADGEMDGPELDIYIMSFSAYGETRFENPVAGSEGERYTSYIVIDNKFTRSTFATKGIDALHVTAAHEFFHMLQGGYRFFPSTAMDSRFLFEASSVWFEEKAYPQVNDYLQYVKTLFASPNRPFHLYSSATYGLGIYPVMLESLHGYQVIRKMWEALRVQEPLDALDTALRSEGNDLGRSLAAFSVWNAFTAGHADTVHYYHDGRLFPALSPLQELTLANSLTISNSAAELETHYYTITASAGGEYTIMPSIANPSQWIYTLVIHEPGYDSRTFTIAGNTPLTFGPVAMNAELRLAVTNIAWPPAGNGQTETAYSIQISPKTTMSDQPEGIIRALPAPFQPERDGRLQIQFCTREPVQEATLYIFNERGALLHSQVMLDIPRGVNCHFWDGRDTAGNPVPSGIYLCAIRGVGQFTPHKFAVVR
jgi:hypothetical protein